MDDRKCQSKTAAVTVTGKHLLMMYIVAQTICSHACKNKLTC